MTVKCINYIDKQAILGYFRAKIYNQRQLANLYGTSERTINRVLVEAGVATSVPRIKGEAYLAMQILKELDVEVTDMKALLLLGQQAVKRMNEDLSYESMEDLGLEYEDVPF